MKFSKQIEAELARLGAAREEKIKNISCLWARLCLLQGKSVSTDELNDLIMNKFQTSSGLDSLTRESIEIVTKGLESSIRKTEGKNKNVTSKNQRDSQTGQTAPV